MLILNIWNTKTEYDTKNIQTSAAVAVDCWISSYITWRYNVIKHSSFKETVEKTIPPQEMRWLFGKFSKNFSRVPLVLKLVPASPIASSKNKWSWNIFQAIQSNKIELVWKQSEIRWQQMQQKWNYVVSESKMSSGNLSSLVLWRKPNVVGVLSTQRHPTTHCKDSSQSSSFVSHSIKDCNGKLSFLEMWKYSMPQKIAENHCVGSIHITQRKLSLLTRDLRYGYRSWLF